MSAWDRDAERDAWEDEQDSIGDEMAAREQIEEEELRDECPECDGLGEWFE